MLVKACAAPAAAEVSASDVEEAPTAQRAADASADGEEAQAAADAPPPGCLFGESGWSSDPCKALAKAKAVPPRPGTRAAWTSQGAASSKLPQPPPRRNKHVQVKTLWNVKTQLEGYQ